MKNFKFGDSVTVITPNQPKKQGEIVGVVVSSNGIVDQYLVLLHALYREYTASGSMHISTIAVHITNLKHF